MLTVIRKKKYDKINFVYRDEKSVHSPYMYFRGLKTALERNGLLYYAYDVYGNKALDTQALLKYPILCITGSHEPIFNIVKIINNQQFVAEINPESLHTRQGNLDNAYYDTVKERLDYFDIYFTPAEVDLDSYWGKPSYWLPSWAHTEILDDISVPVCDKLGFIGLRRERSDFLSQDKNKIILAENTIPKNDSLENVVELCKLINKFKILLNPVSARVMAMTGKTYEYMACKRMCLCYLNESWMFKTKLFFEDNRDIVFFETFEEMEDKYKYYINNEKQLNEISLAGYEHVRRFHNADLRAKRLAEIVLHHANGGKFNPEYNDVESFISGKKSRLSPALSQADNNKLKDLTPFMNEYEIKSVLCCFNLFKNSVKVLEWGSGDSTVYFPSKLLSASTWDSVEHNPEWAARTRALIEGYDNPNIRVHFVGCNKGYQEGIDDGDFDTFRDYILFPTELGKRFQIILVDGRARAECMQIGWMLLEDKGVMVLHDAQRFEYNRGVPPDCFYLRMTNPLVQNGGPISVLFMSKSADLLIKLAATLRRQLPRYIELDGRFDTSLCTAQESAITARDFLVQGVDKLRSGNSEQALSYLKQAKNLCSNMPDVHFAIATAYAQLGDLHSARKACQIELSLRPENDGAKRLLGKIERMVNVVEPTCSKQSVSESLEDSFSGDTTVQTIEGPVLQRNSNDNNIKISIILTVYQKEFQIAQIIKGIINNTTSPFQLVIVYDGCTDRSEQVVNQTLLQNKGLMQELKVVCTPDVCELMANNTGMKTADGEYWILVRDDMLITEKGWEKRIIHPMEVWNDVFSVSARNAHSFICSAPPEKKVSYTCTELAQRAVFKIRDAVNRGPLALRASTMKELNYFDEAYFPDYFDDMDLCTRAYRKLNKVSGVYHIDWQNLRGTVGSNTNHVLTTTGDMHKDVIRRNRYLFWYRYHDYYNGRNHDEDRILVFGPARSAIVSAAKSIEAIDLYRIGSDYGGWAVDLDLVSDGSVVISAGVGEDISFDMGLIALKKCSVISIDPTEKARKYIEDNKHPNISFIQKALCAQSGSQIKMYKNTNPEFVSDSILPSHDNVSDAGSYTVGTINIPDILSQCPDVSILKMDIEGAEYEVISSLDRLDIPQVCIEFHHFCSDFTEDDTKKCIERMKRLGYVAAYDTNPQKPFTEFTFIHKKCVSNKSPVEMNVGT